MSKDYFLYTTPTCMLKYRPIHFANVDSFCRVNAKVKMEKYKLSPSLCNQICASCDEISLKWIYFFDFWILTILTLFPLMPPYDAFVISLQGFLSFPLKLFSLFEWYCFTIVIYKNYCLTMPYDIPLWSGKIEL